MEVAGFATVQIRGDLDPLRRSMGKAKTETEHFDKSATGAFDRASKSTNQWARDTVRGSKSVAAANDNVVKSTNLISGGYQRALSSFKAFAATAIAGFAVQHLLTASRDFSASMAEVSTLLPVVEGELDMLTKASREFARTYGTSATEQSKAFYQAISAGAGNAAEATTLLDAANKVAVGGVTDVETAVNGLTTAMNVYRSTGLTATEASDALFVGMRAGKTTIAELSRQIGQIIPFASKLGVSFDEAVASISALTTQGLRTSVAVTSLKQVFVGIAKPTSEAAEMAKQMGIEFNAAALKSKGMATFLKEVIEAAGGSETKLTQLFGSVEALNAVFAFAGGGGETFNKILGDMEKKAGATEEAFNRVAQSFDFRLTKALAALADIGLSLGNLILAVLVPALEVAAVVARGLSIGFEALGADMGTISKIAPIVGTALLFAFGPAILANIAGGFKLMTTVAIVGLNALRLAIMANPLGLIATGIATAITAAYQFRDSLGVVGDMFDWLFAKAKYVLEAIKFAVETVKVALEELGIISKGGDSNINVNINGETAAQQIRTALPEGAGPAGAELEEALKRGGASAGDSFAQAQDRAAAAAVARYEQMNGIVVKEVGSVLVAGGKYLYNQVTGGVTEVGEKTQETIAKGGDAAGQKMQQGITAGGAAAGQQLELAGHKVGGAIADILQTQAVEIARLIKGQMRAEITLMLAESAKLVAEAKKARAEADQIRRQSISGSGSGGGGSLGGGGGSMSADFGLHLKSNRGGMTSPTNPLTADNLSGGGSLSSPSPSGDGGPAPAAPMGMTTTTEAPKVELQVLNVWDPDDMVNVMGSQAGRTQLINFAKANQEELRAILGVAS